MAVDPRTAGRWAPILPARGGAMPRTDSHVKLAKPGSKGKAAPKSHVKAAPESHVKTAPESHVKNRQLIERGFEAFNNGDAATLTELIASDCVQRVPGSNRFSGDHK